MGRIPGGWCGNNPVNPDRKAGRDRRCRRKNARTLDGGRQAVGPLELKKEREERHECDNNV